jgi:Uma2 family endonuclease
MATQAALRKFTVDEYHRLAETGILSEDDRVELIEGVLIQMPPISSAHAGGVDRLTMWLAPALRGRCIVRVQSPIRLGPYSEPQPDLALLRPREDFYAASHPGPADVLLVIEVAESSADYEPNPTRLPLYGPGPASREAWVVDLAREEVVVGRDPSPEGYRTLQVAGGGNPYSLAFPDLILSVDEILG